MNRPLTSRLACLAAALVGLAVSLPVAAQALRDPTRPPVAVQGGATSALPSTVAALSSGQWAVVVRDGVAQLVYEARLYSAGQLLGTARIERVSETEVWLREAGALHKLRIFPGVDRQAVKSGSAASVPPRLPVSGH